MLQLSWLSRSAQAGYFTLALVALLLGFMGIVTPLLPTTPFLLVAVWAAAKSSQRLHHWLLIHPVIGPPLMAWRQQGAISASAKRCAMLMLALSGLIVIALNLPWVILVACLCLFLAVGVFIGSRPLPSAPFVPSLKICETISLYQGGRVYADIRAYSDPEAYHE